MVVIGMTLCGLSSTPPAAGATRVGPIEPEVLKLRAEAWRAWFAGDEKSLRKILPGEFIGIGMTGGPFSSRTATIEEARKFQAEGGRLVSLEFPETRAHSYGNVVVLYGRYKAVIESQGAQRTVSGRLTEVFAHLNGRWEHPGWHLDTMPPAP